MIKSIHLRNFRLHKNLKVEFDQNITTIVGKSYAGKSTIVRALRWVCLNKPPGTSVIHWGEKECSVRLKIDHNTVTRVRGRSKNLYLLKTRKKGKEESYRYEAFGNDVPERIEQMLNISELNFQQQHSLPFWFGETAGEVSRKLNRIVNLGTIDSTLSNLSSMLNKSKNTVEVCKSRLKEIRQQKKELQFVEHMTQEWKTLQSLQRKYNELDYEVFDLEEMIDKIEDCEETVQKTRPPDISSLTKRWGRYSELQDECLLLQKRVDNLIRVRKDVVRLKEKSKCLQKTMETTFGKTCPLCGTSLQHSRHIQLQR